MPAPDAALGESTAPPVCRHWSRTGTCLYAERCRFLHPPDRDGVDAYDPSNKPVERSDEKGDPERGTQGRRRVRKRGKCGFLRRFMLDTFGLERLRRGVVLDVGGGNGELSFELENLNDVRCVVVDPQRIAVRKLEVKLRGGWYHRTAPLQRYNTAPAAGGGRDTRGTRTADSQANRANRRTERLGSLFRRRRLAPEAADALARAVVAGAVDGRGWWR